MLAASLPVAVGESARPGRVIVGFLGDIPAAYVNEMEAAGNTVLREDSNLDYVLVYVADIMEFTEAMHARAEVAFAYEDPRGSLSINENWCSIVGSSAATCSFSCGVPLPGGTPNDQYFHATCSGVPAKWPLTVTDTVGAWSATTGSPLLVIAVIDTGVDPTHPDLAANMLQINGVFGINLITDTAHPEGPTAPPIDDVGHGTFVAGIASAVRSNGIGTTGVAQAKILNIKACDATGCFSSAVASGIAAAATLGATVATLSLQTPDPSLDPLTERAVAFASARGLLMVGAAGNSHRSHAAYPAAYPEVIAVSALDQHGNFAENYSNYGPEVDLAAPGGDGSPGVRSPRDVLGPLAGGGYGFSSGTSFAVPYVAGAAILVKHDNLLFNAEQIRDRLYATATPHTDTERYGHGKLNVGAAVN